MTRRSRPGLRALLILVALCFGPVFVAAPQAQAGVHHGEPAVGQCYDYGYRAVDASSNSASPVPCDARHTALTVDVVTVPRGVDLADKDQTFASFGSTCYRAIARTLGQDRQARALSAYSLIWFEPSAAQQQHGARWVRCDVALVGLDALSALPTPLLGPAPLSDSVAHCLAPHGDDEYVTSCSSRHDFRAVAALKLSGRYKSDAAFLALGARRCPAIAGRHWYASWPNLQQWNSGDRVLVCYHATHH